MVIYFDVLFVINSYITYFQIIAFSIFIHKNIIVSRKITASLLAGISSFVIFIPHELILLNIFLKFCSCIITVIICTFKTKIKNLIKYILIYLFINFSFAGLFLAFYYFLLPVDVLFINGYLYMNINSLMLIICTVIAYLVIKIIRRLLDKNSNLDRKYKVKIINNGNYVVLSGFSDTGNSLTDYFSGLPVIVCNKMMCNDISPPLPDDLRDSDLIIKNKFRIIPISTVSSKNYIYAFKPQSIIISDDYSNEYNVEALIGLTDQISDNYNAIFNPKLLV